SDSNAIAYMHEIRDSITPGFKKSSRVVLSILVSSYHTPCFPILFWNLDTYDVPHEILCRRRRTRYIGGFTGLRGMKRRRGEGQKTIASFLKSPRASAAPA